MDNKNTGADFFKNRLENLLNTLLGKEVVLVNACTKGYNNPKDSKTKPFLWRFVEKSVESLTLKEKKEIQYFRINHPSSWRHNEKNREIKDNRQLTLKKG